MKEVVDNYWTTFDALEFFAACYAFNVQNDRNFLSDRCVIDCWIRFDNRLHIIYEELYVAVSITIHSLVITT